MGLVDWHAIGRKWGNGVHAACPAFCEAMEDAYKAADGNVLELGSGKTTIGLDKLWLAEEWDSDRTVASVEQHWDWYNKLLPRVSHGYDLRYVPLDGGWFRLGMLNHVRDLGLVVVDGPSGSRMHLELLADRFLPGCVLMFDDAKRDRVRIEKWADKQGQEVRFEGTGRGIAWVEWDASWR